MGQTSRWFTKPTVVRPYLAWLFGAFGCAWASAWFLRSAHMHLEIRYTLPVCIGLSIVTIGVAVLVFLRFQQRAFLLTQHPQFVPRFVGTMFRVGCTYPPIVVVIYLQGDNTLAIPFLIMIALMSVGASIAYAGSVRRVGDEHVCAACGYECRTESERCAECGSYWFKTGGLIRGHRVVQPGAIAAGMIIVLIGTVGMLPTRFSLERLGLYLMPDSIRIRAATIGPSYVSEGKLQDLLAGPLSSENDHFLATRLLDQRLKEEDLPAAAVTWLERKLLVSGLTASLGERFFEEMVEFWLEGPDKVIAGEQFTPLIASIDRECVLGSSLTLQIYFAGISTDKGKTFSGRGDFTRSPGTVSNVWYRQGRRSVFDDAGVPLVSIDIPGEHEIVVRMWIAIVPLTARSFSAKWNDDGTPDLPQTALWTKEVVLRRLVSVEKNGTGEGNGDSRPNRMPEHP